MPQYIAEVIIENPLFNEPRTIADVPFNRVPQIGEMVLLNHPDYHFGYTIVREVYVDEKNDAMSLFVATAQNQLTHNRPAYEITLMLNGKVFESDEKSNNQQWFVPIIPRIGDRILNDYVVTAIIIPTYASIADYENSTKNVTVVIEKDREFAFGSL